MTQIEDETEKYFQLPKHSYTKPEKNWKNKMAFVYAISALTVVFGFLAFTVFVPVAKSIAKDSGVSACETMQKNVEDNVKSTSGKMTLEQRDKARKPFQDSRYPDLRVAGTNLVDSLYDVDQKIDSADLGQTMAMAALIRSDFTTLQTACSAHGVNVPALPTP
jgi:hypothetical protein